LDFNGGFMPVLESPDGTMINESAVIAMFASEYARGKGLPLTPSENAPGDVAANMKTAQHRLMQLKFDPISLAPIFMALGSKFADEEGSAKLRENLPKLEQFFVDNLNGGNYLSGTDQPMYVDLHCFPMASRLTMIEGSIYDAAF
jgi:glutathione S-transferase